MSARLEAILGNRKRKNARENSKRVTSSLSATKTEGRVDRLPQNVEKMRRRKNIDMYVSEPH
jgi:hypothetical protein